MAWCGEDVGAITLPALMSGLTAAGLLTLGGQSILQPARPFSFYDLRSTLAIIQAVGAQKELHGGCGSGVRKRSITQIRLKLGWIALYEYLPRP